MKDLPAFLWILITALAIGTSLAVYSRMGAKALPPPQSAWDAAETVRQALQSRSETLKVGESRTLEEIPYTTTLLRLPNAAPADAMTHYLLKVEVKDFVPTSQPWIGGGLTIGIVDLSPEEGSGQVRMVVLSKQQSLNL